MNVEDIVKLIEACKTSGVQKLKFEKLEICLHPPEQVAAASIAVQRSFQAVENHDDPMDEDLDELRIQSLLIDDPLAYEGKMRNAQNTRRAQ